MELNTEQITRLINLFNLTKVKKVEILNNTDFKIYMSVGTVVVSLVEKWTNFVIYGIQLKREEE